MFATFVGPPRCVWELTQGIPRGRKTAVIRVLGALSVGLGLVAAAPTIASAQGFFEFLFGSGFRRSAPPPLPSRASSFVDRSDSFGGEQRHSYGGEPAGSGSGGYGTAYCVRTCDGHYFPLQRQASASPAELCKAFCPTSKTAVFYGSKIDHAIGPGGTRYADLDNAFAYRDKLVEGCTCTGKDAAGLAPVDLADDMSLRSGDIVAINGGLSVVTSGRSKSAEFTPINTSSREWSKRVAGIKVRPAPPQHKITPVAEDTPKLNRKSRRSAQFR
jgi:hypothetical protein